MKRRLDIPTALFAGNIDRLKTDRVFVEWAEDLQAYSVEKTHIHIKTANQVSVNGKPIRDTYYPVSNFVVHPAGHCRIAVRLVFILKCFGRKEHVQPNMNTKI